MMQNLRDREKAKEFYDKRYEEGYMESWPDDKKARVVQVIKSLDLPSVGDALDFGCGNGIFTAILRDTLRGWNIYGCDISEVAVRHARNKNPDSTFFMNDDPRYLDQKFDFVFSHHVLEHVLDIQKVARQMKERTTIGSTMLHILPCGNEGSFEWKLCTLREDGINKNIENRFFFEDEGHMRRLTTESCTNLFNAFGFVLKKEFYSNQEQGAINWITRSHPFVTFTMCNPFGGRNMQAKLRLSLFLFVFLSISAVRLPYVISERFNLPLKILFWPSKQIDQYLIQKSNQEWENKKSQRNGSEMYLYFRRLSL